MIIKWHRLARQDLCHVRADIARDNPDAAARVAQSIRSTVERLADNPLLGRPGPVIDTRERVVTSTPYPLPHTVADGEIVILRVLHGRQRWPEF
jgi:toxin ParE1/3/4